MRLMPAVVLGLLLGACSSTTETKPKTETKPYSLAFDGSDYAQVASTTAAAIDGFSAWTAEMWVKPEPQGDRRQFLVGQWGDPGAASWAVELEEGYVMGETHNGATSVRISDYHPLILDTWHHIALTYDQGRATVYVDGNAIVTANSMPVPMQGVQPVRLGAQAASTGFFYGAMYLLTGRLAEVRLWSSARTAQQIASQRSQRLKGNEAGLVAYWPLNDGTGDPADLVHGTAALLGGPNHEVGRQPAFIVDTPPVN